MRVCACMHAHMCTNCKYSSCKSCVIIINATKVYLEGNLRLQLLGDAVKYRQGARNAARTLPERFDNLFGILESSEGGDKIHLFPWKTRGTKREHAHRRREKLTALLVNLEKKTKRGETALLV